jgi:endonuclease/exonuclease/phosphatase family metal-dependent hydrolase
VDTFRVLTLNVFAHQHADGARRHEVVRDGLARLSADVLALQEVTRTARFDQVADLVGDRYSVVDHPGASDDGVGACLAVRWPVVSVDVLDLTRVPGGNAVPWSATVAVEVAAPEPWGPLLLVHHKPTFELDREAVRERQSVAAARFVEELVADRPDVPVVLLGDLDASQDAASVRFWTGRQSLEGTSVRYEDAWAARHGDDPGHTFTPANPLVRAGTMPSAAGRRIDYVMVRSGSHGPLLEVADCRLVLDQPVDGTWASDHFGVCADLRRPPRPPGEPT